MMTRQRVTPNRQPARRRWLAAVAGIALVGCDAIDEAAAPVVSTVDAGTVAVGELPAELDLGSLPPTEPPTSATTVSTQPPAPETIGETVTGNRVLVVGDSSLTRANAEEQLCTALGDLGWAVETAVVAGQVVEHGPETVRQRLPDDERPPIDAILVSLDNLDRIPADDYTGVLDELVAAAGSTPVALMTLALDPDDGEASQLDGEINDHIRSVLAEREDVFVIEWAEAVAQDDALTDGVEPTEDGVDTQLSLITDAFGETDGLSQCVDLT